MSDDEEEQFFCVVCQFSVYGEGTREEWTWIQCDQCDTWVHAWCVGVYNIPDDVPEEYICPRCKLRNNFTTRANLWIGDLVWGKGSGGGFWPAYVSVPHIPALRLPRSDELFVMFYQGSGADDYAYMKRAEMEPLDVDFALKPANNASLEALLSALLPWYRPQSARDRDRRQKLRAPRSGPLPTAAATAPGSPPKKRRGKKLPPAASRKPEPEAAAPAPPPPPLPTAASPPAPRQEPTRRALFSLDPPDAVARVKVTHLVLRKLESDSVQEPSSVQEAGTALETGAAHEAAGATDKAGPYSTHDVFEFLCKHDWYDWYLFHGEGGPGRGPRSNTRQCA